MHSRFLLPLQRQARLCLPIGNHPFRLFRCGHKIAKSAFQFQAMIIQSDWKIIQFSPDWRLLFYIGRISSCL